MQRIEIKKSQNQREIEVGRHLWRSNPKSELKLDQLAGLPGSCPSSRMKMSQHLRVASSSVWQLYSKEILFCLPLNNLLYLNLCPWSPVLASRMTERKSVSLFCVPPQQALKHIVKILTEPSLGWAVLALSSSSCMSGAAGPEWSSLTSSLVTPQHVRPSSAGEPQ